MIYLANLAKREKAQIVSVKQDLTKDEMQRMISVFDFSEQNGGTYDSAHYYNDYVIIVKDKYEAMRYNITGALTNRQILLKELEKIERK